MKQVFTNVNGEISTYNNQLTNSTLSSVENEATSIFTPLTNQVVFTIENDGKYVFGENTNSSNKFMKIIVDSGVNAEIYEYNNTEDSVNMLDVELEVKDNANVYYLNIDRLNNAYINRKVTVATNAVVNYHTVSLNKAFNENKVIVDLNGEGAECDFKLITVASEETHNTFDVSLNNMVGKTKANIWQKAVAKSGGQNEFLATGYIHKDCPEAENFQESRVLLLDEASKGDASPLLLINHHDVLAGHAAGVSRVNEEELYYLQTRGITKNEAEKLMTIAFVKPLIDEMKTEELQAEILAELTNSLTK